MSQDTHILLPPPYIRSPKSLDFKTPPHSTSKYESQKMANADSGSTQDVIRHGLLSPELSSPQIRSFGDDGSNELDDLLRDASRDIPTITTDNVDTDDRSSKRVKKTKPLPAPEFSKKRSFASLASTSSLSSDRPGKRSRRLKGPQHFNIPPPEEMTPVVFHSDDKPPFSYATLIGMALLRSPTRQLTLSQIYHWISSHFRYYKKGEVGWQNSIRHNLSLNKSFQKAEKSKDGKGHYWRIVAGYEYQFCDMEESKRAASSESKRKPKAPTKKEAAPLSVPASSLPSVLPSVSSLQLPNPSITTAIAATASSTVILPVPSLNPITPQKTGFDFHGQSPVKLGAIPELAAPSPSFRASAGGDHIIFKSFFNSPDGSYAQDSPRQLPFTSSFNCKSNFELSPIRSGDTGPLLEPLTPKRQTPSSSSASKQPLQLLQQQQQQPQQQKSQQQQPQDDPLGTKFKTPSNLLQTPLINLGSSSMIRRLWASPSYLEDFYTSPVGNADTDSTDSVAYKSIYGSPLAIKYKRIQAHQGSTVTTAQTSIDSRIGVSSKQHTPSSSSSSKGSSSNGYTTNEIFGIDICSINHDDDHLR